MKIELIDNMDIEKASILRVFFNEYFMTDFGVVLTDGKVVYDDC